MIVFAVLRPSSSSQTDRRHCFNVLFRSVEGMNAKMTRAYGADRAMKSTCDVQTLNLCWFWWHGFTPLAKKGEQSYSIAPTSRRRRQGRTRLHAGVYLLLISPFEIGRLLLGISMRRTKKWLLSSNECRRHEACCAYLEKEAFH
jgi:hypothetical protein